MKRIALVTIAAIGTLALAETTLQGAGATFPAPLYEVMFGEYAKCACSTTRPALARVKRRFLVAAWTSRVRMRF